MCKMLRACEQRILLSKPNIELSAVYGYEAGRSDGLDAARDAVVALCNHSRTIPTGWCCGHALAAAAIDDLQATENPPLSPAKAKPADLHDPQMGEMIHGDR